MDKTSKGPSAPQKSHSLFQVYLRLRPPQAGAAVTERFLTVEPAPTDAESTAPTHITLNPPNDRRRPVEKFAFTQVFTEDATQLDVFHCTNVVSLVEGVLAPHGGDGTDALLATLGVSGSGKSHTTLGSRSQRGMTQLSLDVIFRSIGKNIVDIDSKPDLEASINASDASEASISSASTFIESVYGDNSGAPRPSSRAPTPLVRPLDSFSPSVAFLAESSHQGLPQVSEPSTPAHTSRLESVRLVCKEDYTASSPNTPDLLLRQDWRALPLGNAHSMTDRRRPLQTRAANTSTPYRSPLKHYMGVTASARHKKRSAEPFNLKGDSIPPTPRKLLSRPFALPQVPDISTVNVSSDPAAEYVVLVSMYEVYNDRIFDLLTPPAKSAATKEFRRRPLIFKSTEQSPDRKLVAGLRKVICSNLNQALMVLEAGLHERRVAGTGSNSASSRSHGFFSVEVKKRPRPSSKRHRSLWGGSTLTVVDLAGSERARDAKTAGATLAEAGKINESLMYLGQCLQMQSDVGSNSKQAVVPFRQCRLTELLFSNSFPSPSSLSQSQSIRRNPQNAVMIVTADPHGDFNATSQILRYSALAREVTVPRIPSITETILQANTSHPYAASQSSGRNSNQAQSYTSPLSSPNQQFQRPPFFPSGPLSPHVRRNLTPHSVTPSEDRVTMENAALEIARLAEETSHLREALAREQEARRSAEAHLLNMEDRMLELEQAVREDCAAEYEERLAVEISRGKAAMQMEAERGQQHWDRKLEVFERSLGTHEAMAEASDDDDTINKENVLVENLEEENARLRREVTILKRELIGRTPSKRAPLAEREDFATSVNSSPRSLQSGRAGRKINENVQPECLQRRMESLSLREGQDDLRRVASANKIRANSRSRADPSGSPVKRVRSRKLTARKWENVLGGGEDIL
ncbi:kinesin motor domain-containing protein [Diaporthe helianthi]|uniref:Kinesin-like protein n=1 Tax=Diaporthe helianthi TaxID=158607 RepID=A0A2P5HVS7_DIAHE|nr:kinesin motor domain-containing protein [Diaporthe helianthi]